MDGPYYRFCYLHHFFDLVVLLLEFPPLFDQVSQVLLQEVYLQFLILLQGNFFVVKHLYFLLFFHLLAKIRELFNIFYTSLWTTTKYNTSI